MPQVCIAEGQTDSRDPAHWKPNLTAQNKDTMIEAAPFIEKPKEAFSLERKSNIHATKKECKKGGKKLRVKNWM